MKVQPVQVTADEMHSKVESWNLPSENDIREYTSNQMIHAYTTGVTDGLEKDEKLFQKQITANSIDAGRDTEEIISFLKSKGINAISAHLRIESRYSIDVLITVSNEDFVKDSFLDVYSFVCELQEKVKTDLYSIAFTFINRSKDFDNEMVKSDGFIASFKSLERPK